VLTTILKRAARGEALGCADGWGYFLCRAWDDWNRRDIGKVFVNEFENAAAVWMGKDSQMCVYHQFCGKGVALEHDKKMAAHQVLAFDHCRRCTYCGLGLYALWSACPVRLVRFVVEFGGHAVWVAP